MQYLYCFGETPICRFSWDRLALSIHPPCLDSALVYYLQCGGWALAGPWLFIGCWSSFLSVLASTVPGKHRRGGGLSHRGGTATMRDSVQYVTQTFHNGSGARWMAHTPPWEAPSRVSFTPQSGIRCFPGVPSLLRFLEFGMLLFPVNREESS